MADITPFSEQLKNLDELNTYINAKAQELANLTKERSHESVETKDINAALSKAQGEFSTVIYNKANPYFKSSYADLDAIVRAIRPALAKNGLSFTQPTMIMDDGSTILVTRLRHTSGQWIETRARLLPPKNDPQSYASTLSYMRRYQLMTLVGCTTGDDDDDAEVAMVPERDLVAKGTAINTKYNPKENAVETISRDQLNEIDYELAEYPDIATMVLDGLKIQSLADMPKSKFQISINRIREIKNARNGVK